MRTPNNKNPLFKNYINKFNVRRKQAIEVAQANVISLAPKTFNEK